MLKTVTETSISLSRHKEYIRKEHSHDSERAASDGQGMLRKGLMASPGELLNTGLLGQESRPSGQASVSTQQRAGRVRPALEKSKESSFARRQGLYSETGQVRLEKEG